MRQHPIGTVPFKFVEFKPNKYIKVTKNPDYWKKDRPYLDGIEYTTRKLAEAAFRPVIFYLASAGCRQPWVKGLTMMTNIIYNGWRMEDVWLDK
jgi:hypothetical protein